MTDNGLVALEKIHKELFIDELWTIRGDREFLWIGHRLQQNILASKPFEDEGVTLSRLSASCIVVEDVSSPQADVLRTLSLTNRHAVGSGYTYWPSTRTITANAFAYVHDQTLDWRSKQFSFFAIAQLCLAETEADWLAEKTGGSIAIREHPESGRRVDADDMLGVLDQPIAEAGRQPSLFADKFEMETIAETAMHSQYVASLGGSAEGVSLEVSFADGTSLTVLKTEEPHRRLGSGLTARLNLPMPVTPEDADRIIAILNEREAEGDVDGTHYGAWCWDEWPTTGLGIAYQAFIPNAQHQPGMAQDAAYSFVKRARWVDGLLNGASSTTDVWRTMEQRFGLGISNDEEY